ncbi:hypothetical protein [Rheinheimera salexigens]|uniref:Uncharacterized protein n=1 Tax=Rheinheimera salexigens TaxID=1628148 RepID=A0A1E7Q849_9GAMM|nr:hypothetical protein [Rheinheimera salexigens]OEY70365.1 hypothetical protein BI198_12860 [Rheinheimera salexigens]
MFAVFGINESKARAMAIKKTAKTTGKGKNLRALTDEEYQAALNANTEKYMQNMKPVILSSEYSTPSVCADFIALAQKAGAKKLEVMIKAPVETKDKKGRAKIVKRWTQYQAGHNYAQVNV